MLHMGLCGFSTEKTAMLLHKPSGFADVTMSQPVLT